MRLSQLRFRRHVVMTSGKPPRKSPAKTLYELLGIRPDADAKTLHRAFRDAAKVHHPDHNPGDQDATRRFTQLVNAYEILRNAEQRDLYDRLLADERVRRRARLTVSDAVAVVALTVVIVGGFALFAQVSNTSIEAARVVEVVVRKVAEITAVQPTIGTETANRDQPVATPTDTGQKVEPSGKSTGAASADARTAPSPVVPDEESHAIADGSPPPDPTGPSEVAKAVDALMAAIDRGDMGKSEVAKAVDALMAAIDRGDMGKSEVAKAVDALMAAIDRGDMGKSKGTKAIDTLAAAIDRGDMGRRPDDQKKNDEPNSLDRTRVGSVGSRFSLPEKDKSPPGRSEVANAVDALVAAIDRGDMGRPPDDQKKNDEPNSLDRTRVRSVESRFSSPEKDKSPPSELATAGEKHDVRTNAKLRTQTKRPVTDRTTVGQATANIRSTSQVALASRNSSPCAGSCSERAPPLFGVGF
jgi:DnaJ domain